MENTQIELHDKIIDLKSFFQRATDELRSKTGLTHCHFLMPDDRNGSFTTKHSTRETNIHLAEKEVRVLVKSEEKAIIFPKTVFHYRGFLRHFLLAKIYWKIRLYSISAIMPIHNNDQIICLILFTDRRSNDWFKKNYRCLENIRQEIAICLEMILLYNRTLEGLIRKYDHSSRKPIYQVTKVTREQAPVLIGKKVEFL